MKDKNTKQSENYQVESENLALPEIHTGKVHPTEPEKRKKEHDYVQYETLAVPEIHIKKK